MHYRTRGADDHKVTFPMLESWNPLSNVATIAAQVSGRRVLCRISLEVLQKFFKATAEEPMSAVKQNRSTLEAAARTLIEKKKFDEDGHVLIQAKDL